MFQRNDFFKEPFFSIQIPKKFIVFPCSEAKADVSIDAKLNLLMQSFNNKRIDQ
jgi:hypothetical protein